LAKEEIILYYIIFVLIILLDQLTKYGAIKYLKGNQPLVIIEDFLEFSYVENFGAAFGILQNRRVFFVLVTIIVIVLILFFLKRNIYCLNKSIKISLVMLMAGAIGNLIDRVRFGYVVDFISIKFRNGYEFPVFNIADSFIVISTILIVYMILFDKYRV